MRAVWSFWSRPFVAPPHRAWSDALPHLLSWVISVQAASRHYPERALVTDTPGRRLLIDQLGLPFTHISTELDTLATVDPGWWALGKIVAQSLQTRPYLHLDSDVFLWKRLPPRIEAAAVIAQTPEQDRGESYRPADIEAAFAATGGVLPHEWEYARSLGPVIEAENCGIVGGNDIAFLNHYARIALDLVFRPENAAGWARLPDKRPYNIVVEQFLLAASVGFHTARPGSPYRGVRTTYLFPSWTEAFDANQSARIGFTHLMAGKSRPIVAERLAARVRRDWPDLYRRCERASAASIAA
jgi:hypothetical protein